MPSNAMKISQFIECLRELQAQHGDIDVVLALAADQVAVAVDGRNVGAAVRFPWGRLPAPVVCIGLWRSASGELTLQPGQKYEVTPTEQEFSYARSEAPVDTPLVVWKRYLGQDTGYVTQHPETGVRRWYVYEGGERAIEIVPDGILGWRLP